MTALDNRKITDDSVPWDSSCYENFNPQYDENYSDYDCYPNDEDELEKTLFAIDDTEKMRVISELLSQVQGVLDSIHYDLFSIQKDSESLATRENETENRVMPIMFNIDLYAKSVQRCRQLETMYMGANSILKEIYEIRTWYSNKVQQMKIKEKK